MNVAIFSWRDLDHPKAGGAELYTHEVASGLSARGHRVVLFVSRPAGSSHEQDRDGYRIIRAGSEISCRFHAARWLWSRKQGLDVVVDEVNTLPFFSPWIVPGKTVLLIFQLAREVWLAEGPWAVGRIGYLIEPLYLSIYRRTPTVTISDSTAATLKSIGLRGEVRVIEVAIAEPTGGVNSAPIIGRIGFVGRVTPSKRIDHMIRALAIVKSEIPNAELVVVGKGQPREISRLRALAHSLRLDTAVMFAGPLPVAERDAFMASFDVIAMTSLREGWGMSISEAARFAVPAVVYPVPGLVDSARDGTTGIICDACEPQSLADAMLMLMRNRQLRDTLGRGAQNDAKRLTRHALIDRFEAALLARANGTWQEDPWREP